MNVIWLLMIVVAAVVPVLYATFSRNAAARRLGHRCLAVAWPFVVLGLMPLQWPFELIAGELFVLSAVVVPVSAICIAVMATERYAE